MSSGDCADESVLGCRQAFYFQYFVTIERKFLTFRLTILMSCYLGRALYK